MGRKANLDSNLKPIVLSDIHIRVVQAMHVLYRISNNSYTKERVATASKEYCLVNFVNNVLTEHDNMTIIADGVDAKLLDFICAKKQKNIEILNESLGSNGASFRFQLDYASGLPKNTIVLFQEDDYIYTEACWPNNTDFNYHEMISQALEFADYISFYDHPDKYMSPKVGGNPLISERGTEKTEVFCTQSMHWKYTNSTTCTFACMVETVQQDAKIWKHFCPANHPHDYQAFLALGLRGRKLATSIPGKATHCDKQWISPFFFNRDV